LNPADGELFSAAKGRGAMLNNLPIHVSTNTDLQDCLLATGFPYDVRKKTRPLLSRLKQFLISSQGIRRLGSAALDLCYVASGRFDGFWEQGLKPWDMAAGALIVKEAGGRTTGFADQPFDLNRNEILATNGLIHMQMLTLLDQEEQEEDI
jgi:myo-inositol-1(or 4)-monophosphatase